MCDQRKYSALQKSYEVSVSLAYRATCMFMSPQCLRETSWAAQGARRKDKCTHGPELWPHAISRHQSRDRTMLRLQKTWPEVTAFHT